MPAPVPSRREIGLLARVVRARPVHPRAGLRLATAALLLLLLLGSVTSGCTGGGTDNQAGPPGKSGRTTASTVSGPLCDLLPSGTDPGNPTSLATEPAEVALQWIPVLTTFEAALRASGLTSELGGTEFTILAPTDDAFGAKFSEDNLDSLMIKRKDALRTLLRAHIVDKPLSVADLLAAGTVTTLEGTTVKITRAETMARLGPEAQTVCADYRVANGRIHVINKVLGNLPTTADEDGHRAH